MKEWIRKKFDMLHRKNYPQLYKECFSCGTEFELFENNDRDEGYFCDECLGGVL